MQINTNDGSKSVTSQSQGNLNTFLGAAGTFLGLMSGGYNILGGRGANGSYFNNADPNSRLITKAEADLMSENTNLKTELAIQKSENYTDKKLVEVTTYLDAKLGKLTDKVDANYHMQQDVNAQQMAYNAAANASIDVLKSQIAGLSGVTKVYIPSSNVCQSGCGCGCTCNQ